MRKVTLRAKVDITIEYDEITEFSEAITELEVIGSENVCVVDSEIVEYDILDSK